LLQQAGINFGIGYHPGEKSLRLSQGFFGAFQGGERGIGRIPAGSIGLSRGRQALQRPGCGAQRGGRTSVATVAWREFGEGGGNSLGSALTLLQPLTLTRQGFLFIDPRRQGGEFVNCVAQPLFVPFSGSDGVTCALKPMQRIAPGAPGFGSCTSQGRRNAEGVKQARVTGWISQAHLLVLALDLHQQRPDAAQKADTNGMVVDEGAGPSVTANHATQHDFIVT
jgi:hypothetical protein